MGCTITKPKVGGTVLVGEKLKGKVPEAKGVLFVYARKPGVQAGPPLAVFRFENPRFPQAFVITAKNLIFKETARNFNPMMAMAGKITIAEVEELVEVGELHPDEIHTPGIFVHKIFKGTNYEKRIEQKTVRKKEA